MYFNLLTEIYLQPTKIENFNRLPAKELNFDRQPTSGPPIQTLFSCNQNTRTWLGIKEAKFFQKVLKPLGSYTQVFAASRKVAWIIIMVL